MPRPRPTNDPSGDLLNEPAKTTSVCHLSQERDLRGAGVEKLFSEQVSSVAKRLKLAECLAFLRESVRWTVIP